jgi:hypothetical protein
MIPRRSRGLVKYHGLVPVEEDAMLQMPAHAVAQRYDSILNAPAKISISIQRRYHSHGVPEGPGRALA